jgi:hypothetical protein
VKRFVIPILISISLSVSATPIANAAVTPGTKCSKIGSKQTFKGKIYTCVKAGKSQVWNKGVTPSQTVPSPSPSPKLTTSPTPTVQDDFRARSLSTHHQVIDLNPKNGDEWVETTIDCWVKSPGEYQAEDSFISIFDPSGNSLIRERLSGQYNSFRSGESAAYYVGLNEMIKNSGKTYSCLFDFIRLDGSQLKKELPAKVPSIIKSPLPKPQTFIYPTTRTDGFQVACLLSNWQDYSLGGFKYDAVAKKTRFEPTSQITLIRDDGSTLMKSGLYSPYNLRSSVSKQLDPNKHYVGIYRDDLDISGEIDRSGGKSYTCKYELVGFNGERLVHTEIVQMPSRSTPTPTPTPLPLITPGALCTPAGATGKWGNGTIYTCKTSPLDTRTRWRL